MKYMLLIYDEERAWSKLSENERQQIYKEYGLVLIEKAGASGSWKTITCFTRPALTC
jgi:hypothetical protein